MASNENFRGYKWSGLSDELDDDDARRWTQSFLDYIDWNALCRYASELRGGEECAIEPRFTMGGRHMVRIINFQGGSRWIARLRKTTGMDHDEQFDLVQREVDCICLVRERTSVPVPMVFGYNASAENAIRAPFILMECLPGNVCMDLNVNFIPSQYKERFYAEMARFQTEISSIMFPKIGAIVRAEDGTYDVGPLHGLGGPFNTATEYLEAWARAAEFHDLSQAKERCGEWYDEVMAQIEDFPHKLEEFAASIPMQDHGPFPLFHKDFGHNNIVVDDAYNVLGVIDWEHASSVPWECVHFPLILSLVPVPMDAPSNYDENGIATDEYTRSTIVDQNRYINTVQEVERSSGLSSLLSATLADQASQDLAYAMKLYTEDGKFGFYTKILDVHHKKWSERKKDVDMSEGGGKSRSVQDGALPPGGALLLAGLHAAHEGVRRILRLPLEMIQRFLSLFGLA